ncbi:MAG: dihydrodipicolinate synthase family protein, partial [Bryobacteraceae bacterium]
MKLQGIFIDAATPFDHTGAIYITKVQHNIDRWNRTGVAGYLLGGPAGESPLLSAGDRVALWKMAAPCAATGKLLLAGIGAEGVAEAATLAEQAAALGYHAVVVEAPRYDTSSEVALLYFRALADRSPIPVVAAARAPLHHPNIAAILDRSGEVGKLRHLAAEGPV